MHDIEFKEAVLPNGLTIQAEIIPTALTAATGFFFRTGARDEASEVMGVSHFLEHMMFKGTEKRTAEDVSRELDELGANHNAWTTAENTAYFAHTPHEVIHEAVDVLADILRPSLRQEDFDEEKQVILEEIAMYADQPFWVLYEAAIERYYGKNPIGHRVLGTVDTVSALKPEMMRAYFEDRYSADNTVVAASGRVDFDALVEQVDRLCGHWPATNPQRGHRAVEFSAGELEVELPENTSQRYSVMLCPSTAMNDDRRYAAGQLAHCIGDVEGSNLFWSVIETGIAEEAQMHFDGRDGCGEMAVTLVCSPENAEKAEDIVRDELINAHERIDDDALVRSRAKIATSVMLASEKPMGRMSRLGVRWTYRLPYRTLDEELDRINDVTLGDILAYRDAFPLDELLVTRGGGH
ncbi:MAG: insulinase family protein [Phycisphaerales bacterium]|nr:insulinase family protein [Phycisphaerales bacterium]